MIFYLGFCSVVLTIVHEELGEANGSTCTLTTLQAVVRA